MEGRGERGNGSNNHPLPRMWFIHKKCDIITHECDFDMSECDYNTHECDYDTQECEFYTHELNFNMMRVTFTQTNSNLPNITKKFRIEF
jgi:hypothetical protein